MTHCKRRAYLLTALLALLMDAVFSFPQAPLQNRAKKPKNRILRFDGGLPLFKTWLQQDVAWIITAEERMAFAALTNDEERDQFIEAFWSRRDPTPDTRENEFKEEHYRRIVYANDHFSSRDPGWKTDRGRIYIVYGPPDHVEVRPVSNAPKEAQHGGDASTVPTETWRYRYLEGVGMDVIIDFVDVCGCGEYQMKMPSELRDALFYVPRGVKGIGTGQVEPGDLSLYLRRSYEPKLKFRDLETILDSKAPPHEISFGVTNRVTRATDVTSTVRITISFQNRGAISADSDGTMSILGRIITLTGHVADTFEGSVPIDPSSASALSLQKSLAVFNTRYRMEIAVQDSTRHQLGTWVGLLKVDEQSQ